MEAITIDGKEYKSEELTEQQKLLISHVADLDNKIAQARFQLDQFSVARDSFMGMLKAALEDKGE